MAAVKLRITDTEKENIKLHPFKQLLIKLSVSA